jgi:hypothetical protein
MHVPNAHADVSKTSDVRAIMSLQDVRTGRVIITYKTCGHDSYSAATVPREPCWPLARHCYSARRLDRAASYRGPCAAWQDNKTRRTHDVKDIICLLLAIET